MEKCALCFANINLFKMRWQKVSLIIEKLLTRFKCLNETVSLRDFIIIIILFAFVKMTKMECWPTEQQVGIQLNSIIDVQRCFLCEFYVHQYLPSM